MRLAEATPRHILAVRLDNIGDVIMLTPCLRALRQRYPDARITLLASPAGSQVAPLLPWIDDVVAHAAMWQEVDGSRFDPAGERDFIRRLTMLHADAAVIFTSFIQSPHPAAYASYLAGIPIRIGQSKEFGGQVLSEWVRAIPDESQQVDHNCHLLESIGVPVEDRRLELRLPRDVDSAAAGLLLERGVDPDAGFVVAAPGASCASRRYDPVRFASVCRRLRDETGLPIVVIGDPRDRERVRSFFETAPSPLVTDLVGKTTVPEMAAIIARSRLVLANNSGPMHIADAFQRAAVILFSGTDLESQWRPRGSPATLLRVPTPCHPCRLFTCRFQMQCLDLPVSAVVGAALTSLSITQPRELSEIA